MLWRDIFICFLVSSAHALQWCKVFQADHMRFKEIENEEEPYFSDLIAQDYDFCAEDQVYYKFALYEQRLIYSAPRPLIKSSTTPYTLAELVPNWSLTNPLSQAFPSWQWNQNPSEGIYSVTNVQIDKFGRAWILDSGVNYATDSEPIFNPKIFIWSLIERKMLKIYEIPKSQYGPGSSRLTNIAVDTAFGCEKTFAIISDSAQFALVILRYNQTSNTLVSWRVKNKSFKPQPKLSNFTYKNKSIDLNLGVYSITRIPSFETGKPDYLYYSSFAGNTWYKVPTIILYNQDLWTKGYAKIQIEGNLQNLKVSWKKLDETLGKYKNVDKYFSELGKVKYTTSARCNYNPDNYGFYCPAPALNAITFWNVTEPFDLDKVIYKSDTLLEYPIQILLNTGRNGKREIYVVSDSFLVRYFSL